MISNLTYMYITTYTQHCCKTVLCYATNARRG